MQTLVTSQRETDQQTGVPFFSIAQRVRAYFHSFFALQGASITKEVRIYKTARFALPKTRQSFHISIEEYNYEE